MAFFELEPFGFDTEMMGHAITSSTIANVHRKKGARMFTFKDFVPTFKQKPTATNFFRDLKSILLASKKGKS